MVWTLKKNASAKEPGLALKMLPSWSRYSTANTRLKTT